MSSTNGHCELLHSSPTVSGGGYVTGTNGRQHARFLAVVPEWRYVEMAEAMLRFPGDEELLRKAEQLRQQILRQQTKKQCRCSTHKRRIQGNPTKR